MECGEIERYTYKTILYIIKLFKHILFRIGNILYLLKIVLSLCAEHGSSKKAMFGANRCGRRVTTVCETIPSRTRVGAALRSQTPRV